MAVAVVGLLWAAGFAAAEERATGSIPKPRPPGAREDMPPPVLHMLPAVATGARIVHSEGRTRLEMKLTRRVEVAAFLLANPKRVILDLEEVNFQLPKAAGHGKGVVSAFRFGLYAPGKSRIVIDLAEDAVIDRAVAVDATDREPARLVVELVPSDAGGFQRALQAQVAGQADRNAGRFAATRAETALPVIVLDAGHGGVDSGAHAPSGELEKAIVLDFATQLRDRLVASGRYAVIMTRDRDDFLSLEARVRIAREAKAALFISIHADSLPSSDASTRGATIYTLSETASDEEAAKMAERENKSDAIAGINLAEEPNEIANLLIDLTQRETRAFSSTFARTLAQQMKQATAMHRLPLRSAGFRVLRAQDVPSVLLELGYMTHAQDVKQLLSPEWRLRTAEVIVRAIDIFLHAREQGGAAATAAGRP